MSCTCQVCGEKFTVFPSRVTVGEGRHCSWGCKIKGQWKQVKRVCQYCEKEFTVIPSLIRRGGGRYCSKRCFNEIQKEKVFSKEHRSKISYAVRRNWLNPNFVKKVIKGLNIRPTKPEMQLQVVLGKHFPQFKYNGDFSLGITLGGLIPDFVNKNGRKEVIEVFGDYWHSRKDICWNRTELGRVMAFNSVGFKCLVIWENELKTKTEAEIVDLIGDFFEGEKNYAKQRRVRSLKK